METLKRVILIVGMLVMYFYAMYGVAHAQPIATSDQSLAWDYSDQIINSFNVVGFDVMYDEDTNNPQNIIDAGRKRLGSLESYFDPFPALNTGTHVANVRACNMDSSTPPARQCGVWSIGFNFRMGVFDAPSNVRIVDTPGGI